MASQSKNNKSSLLSFHSKNHNTIVIQSLRRSGSFLTLNIIGFCETHCSGGLFWSLNIFWNIKEYEYKQPKVTDLNDTLSHDVFLL